MSGSQNQTLHLMDIANHLLERCARFIDNRMCKKKILNRMRNEGSVILLFVRNKLKINWDQFSVVIFLVLYYFFFLDI